MGWSIPLWCSGLCCSGTDLLPAGIVGAGTRLPPPEDPEIPAVGRGAAALTALLAAPVAAVPAAVVFTEVPGAAVSPAVPAAAASVAPVAVLAAPAAAVSPVAVAAALAAEEAAAAVLDADQKYRRTTILGMVVLFSLTVA